MGLKDLLSKYFPKRKGTRKTSWRDAEQFFRDEKSRELEEARDKKKEHIQRTGELVEQLGEALEAFQDYDDSKDLQVVEDVAQNFYRSRKRLVKNFEASQNMEEHVEEIREFLDEFNDVSRKEGEVMKYVKDDSKELSTALENIIGHRERLEAFSEGEYMVVKQLGTVEEFVEEIQRLEEELENAQKELEGKDTRDIAEDIEDIEEKLDEIERSEDWKHKKSLEREKKELEKKKTRKEKEIKSKISEMHRGLTKILYSIENEGLEFKNRKKVLERLESRQIDSLDDPLPEAKEALEKLEEEEILEGRDLQKFREGVKGLENFEELKDEVTEFENQIEDVEDGLEGLEIGEKKDELRQRKKRLEDDLEEKKDEVRSLEETRNEKELEFDRRIRELQHFLNSVMRGTVIVEEAGEKGEEK
ncbi:hypothetical protein AQV86_03800 [Nanohaloarchaea archaeon SG9]|nr:hypothetical protein AQV86_03800 [Nanohaloarchaea archaeon SG9]